MYYLCKLSDVLWDPLLPLLFLAVGGYFTLRSGFFQLRFPTWLRATVGSLGRPSPKGGGLTPVQALSTALASTIGTGSIAGVATAIVLGGPGAVFWMWVSAFFGMMTGFVEKTLAVRYRESDGQGGYQGGPMCYMTRGLGKLGGALSVWFSLAGVCASLAGGAMVQANSMASALKYAWGVPPWATGLAAAGLVGWTVFGGLSRVGRLSERLVPAMAGLFLTVGALTLFVHRSALPGAFAAIFNGALRPQAALGGHSAALALRYGMARGVFTNEAGLGSSAMAHAAARTDSPARQGLWGILEVFFATLVVCTVTALVLLTSGVYPASPLLGADLSAAAFSTVLGPLGGPFVALCLLLFAFTSLLGWSYYGQRAICHLWGGSRPGRPFLLLYLAFVVLGAVTEVGAAWSLADLCNGLMALPNLAALVLLSPEALGLLACIS